MKLDVAIVIPAHNEERTISEVIRAFVVQDRTFSIYVVDNNSTDQTRRIAEATLEEVGVRGCVLFESRKGKSLAIRNAFSKIDADVYVMVDADMTYPAAEVFHLIEPVLNGSAEMVVGDRLSSGEYQKENKRIFHEGGNRFVRWLISRLYGYQLNDILSGYRAFSRRFVKTYPILCDGFELEADLTLHALDKKLAFLEIPVGYKDRPEGSVSKLSTMQDGIRILVLIFNIFRYYKPLLFFSAISAFFLLACLFFGSIPLLDYLHFRYVYHVPLAILSSALGVLSILFLSIALVLDGIARNHKFEFELRWLSSSCSEREENGR